MDNQLAAGYEIRHRMLPGKRSIVALIADEGRNVSCAQFCFLYLLLHVRYRITYRALNAAFILRCLQLTTASAAAEVYEIVEAFIRHKLCVANRTLRVRSFCLIIHHIVAAGRTGNCRHAIYLDVDDVSAGTFNMLARKESG